MLDGLRCIGADVGRIVVKPAHVVAEIRGREVHHTAGLQYSGDFAQHVAGIVDMLDDREGNDDIRQPIVNGHAAARVIQVNVGVIVWFSPASVSVAASAGSKGCGVTEVEVPAVVHLWTCHKYTLSAGVASEPN